MLAVRYSLYQLALSIQSSAIGATDSHKSQQSQPIIEPARQSTVD